MRYLRNLILSKSEKQSEDWIQRYLNIKGEGDEEESAEDTGLGW